MGVRIHKIRPEDHLFIPWGYNPKIKGQCHILKIYLKTLILHSFLKWRMFIFPLNAIKYVGQFIRFWPESSSTPFLWVCEHWKCWRDCPSQPSLLAYAVRTKISWPGLNYICQSKQCRPFNPVPVTTRNCLAFVMPLCASVYMCLVVTCWERADLLALVCGILLRVC